MGLLAALLLPASVHAALDVQAKAVKTESNEKEEIWAIRIDLKNTGSTPLGPLLIQYRYSGFSEFDEEGKPEGPLVHNEGTLKQVVAAVAAGEKVSVDSPGMNFAGGADSRQLAKVLIQSIRVRAWQNGILVGEFAEKGGKAADVDWPLNPPPVTEGAEGAEAGSGPWLRLADGRADFSGIALGASAAEVFKMLKTHGSGKIDAKPEPLHGHPLRISSADLPGVTFGFDAAKKLTAIAITDASRLQLPGKAILGKSRISDLDAAFGHGSKPDPASDPFGPAKPNQKPVESAFSSGTKPDPLPDGATDARQFQFAGSCLSFSDTSAAPGIATTALLETSP